MIRFKQLATEKFNNLDLDKLPIDKTRIEKILWTVIKKAFRKIFLAVLAEILKDPELIKEIQGNANDSQKA